jgi:hypothetical protein
MIAFGRYFGIIRELVRSHSLGAIMDMANGWRVTPRSTHESFLKTGYTAPVSFPKRHYRVALLRLV